MGPTNRVKEVTFKVSRPDGQYGLHKLADTTFALGLGPCGRWVQHLEVEVTDHLLRIRQHSTEFDITEVLLRKANEGYEIKEFIYKIADIHGRIVTTK